MDSKRASTGLAGLDSILGGGYPLASPTLISGGPGCGKTVFCLSFAHGQLVAETPVVIATGDESPDRLCRHMDSFDMAGGDYQAEGKLAFVDLRPNLSEQIVGEFDLSPVVERIWRAIEKTGARALVIDSLQNLLLGLGIAEPKSELIELFDWSRQQGITLLATAARRDDRRSMLLEEYAVDCVIDLSQRLEDHLMTRYLRVVKMRGAAHGTNEYPFSLNKKGVSILPVTATRLSRAASDVRLSTGVARIDALMGGQGYFAGSVVMLSGRAGSGKTILATTMAMAAAAQGHKVGFVSFEESEADLRRNLGSVGLEIATAEQAEKLLMRSVRAVEMGLEDHLLEVIDLVAQHQLELLVLDPISALIDTGAARQIKLLLVRFISLIKDTGVTLLMTELFDDGSSDVSALSVSSLVDTWLRLRQNESNGELNRLINVVKSRGNPTSNQIKEFTISERGIEIEDPYLGEGTLVVGSAKAARVAQDRERAAERLFELERIEQALGALEKAHAAQVQSIDAERQIKQRELEMKKRELERQANTLATRRDEMQSLRE
jgi:circadian clock protein KaiC